MLPYPRLRVQLFALVSIALLPLGLLAVVQSSRVYSATQQSASVALLSATETQARARGAQIRQAGIVAQLVGTVAPNLVSSPEVCRRMLASYLAKNLSIDAIEIFEPGKNLDCAAYRTFETATATPTDGATDTEFFTVSNNSGDSTLVITEPLPTTSDSQGYVLVTLPLQSTITPDDLIIGKLDSILLGPDGALLSTGLDRDMALAELPAAELLETFQSDEPHVVTGTNQNGDTRSYSIVPISDSAMMEVGVWSDASPSARLLQQNYISIAFPWLMWIAGLGIVLFAIHRLILRHLYALTTAMRGFGKTRTVAAVDLAEPMPAELQAAYDEFRKMAQNILQDEARLEDYAREQAVLLKEVHHRTRNSLQVVSSIASIAYRRSTSPETERVVSMLSEKIDTLILVQEYTQSQGYDARLPSAEILDRLVRQHTTSGVAKIGETDVTCKFAPQPLYPGEITPLALLLSELLDAAGNHKSDGTPVHIATTHSADGFELAARYTGQTTPENLQRAPLVRAFVRELGATLTIDRNDADVSINVAFQPTETQTLGADF